MLNLNLHRFWSDAESTNGVLFITDPQRFTACFSLEDEFRTEKVWGETRIPAGRYRLKLNTNEAAPGMPETNHQKYQRRYGPEWHVGMIELVDVPDFSAIQIHIGNSDDDSAGCILTGESTKRGWVASSRAAYERLYPILAEALVRKEPCYITIKDHDRSGGS